MTTKRKITITIVGDHSDNYVQVVKQLSYTNDLDYYKKQYDPQNNLVPCNCSYETGNEWQRRHVLIANTIFAHVSSRHCAPNETQRWPSELIHLALSECTLMVCNRLEFDVLKFEIYANAIKLAEIKCLVIFMDEIDENIIEVARNVFRKIDYQLNRFECIDNQVKLNEILKWIHKYEQQPQKKYRGILWPWSYGNIVDYELGSGDESSIKIPVILTSTNYSMSTMDDLKGRFQINDPTRNRIIHDFNDSDIQWTKICRAKIHYSPTATIFPHGSLLQFKRFASNSVNCHLFYRKPYDLTSNRTFDVCLRFEEPIWFESFKECPALGAFSLHEPERSDDNNSVCFGLLISILQKYRNRKCHLLRELAKIFYAIRTNRLTPNHLQSNALIERHFYDFMKFSLHYSQTDAFICTVLSFRQRFTYEDKWQIGHMIFQCYVLKKITLDFEKLSTIFELTYLYNTLNIVGYKSTFFIMLNGLCKTMYENNVIDYGEKLELESELERMSREPALPSSILPIDQPQVQCWDAAFFNHFIAAKLFDPYRKNQWLQFDSFRNCKLIRRLISNYEPRTFREFYKSSIIFSHYFRIDSLFEQVLREQKYRQSIEIIPETLPFQALIYLNGNRNNNLRNLFVKRGETFHNRFDTLVYDLMPKKWERTDHELCVRLNAIYLLLLLDTIENSNVFHYDEMITHFFRLENIRTGPFIRFLNSLEIILYRSIIVGEADQYYWPFNETTKFDCLKEVAVVSKAATSGFRCHPNRKSISFYDLLITEHYFDLGIGWADCDLCPDWLEKLHALQVNSEAILFLKFLRFLFIEVVHFLNKLHCKFSTNVCARLIDTLNEFDVLMASLKDSDSLKDFLLF